MDRHQCHRTSSLKKKGARINARAREVGLYMCAEKRRETSVRAWGATAKCIHDERELLEVYASWQDKKTVAVAHLDCHKSRLMTYATSAATWQYTHMCDKIEYSASALIKCFNNVTIAARRKKMSFQFYRIIFRSPCIKFQLLAVALWYSVYFIEAMMIPCTQKYNLTNLLNLIIKYFSKYKINN